MKVFMSNPIQKKICCGCKNEKDLNNDNFYKNKRTNDGYSIYCIPCSKENTQRHNERKKEKEQRLETSVFISELMSEESSEENTDLEIIENMEQIILILSKKIDKLKEKILGKVLV